MATCTAAALSLTACSSSSSSSSDSSSTIVIGNEADLTGNATVGVPGNYGVQFAVKQINDNGGISGHKIKLVTEDSQGSATGGTNSVRRLIDADKVVAIVNTSTSNASVPAIPAIQSRQIPFVISAGTDPVLVKPANTYVFISPAVSLTYAVKAYVDFAQKQNYKKVAIIAATSALGTEGVKLWQQDAPADGIAISTVQSYVATDTDFSAQIHAAQGGNPDAIFIFGDFAGSIGKQIRNAGIKTPLLYDAATTDPLLVKGLGADAEGVVSFQTQATQLIDATTAPMSTWKSQFAAAYASPPAGVPSQFSLEGYQTTFVLAEAIKQALTKGKLTGPNIRTALEGLNGFVAGKTDFPYAVPIGYPVSFTKDNHAGNSTVTPVIVKSGKFVPFSQSQ
jgi:branched-chain amino acid transport system substrate-binding protein